MNYSSPSAVLFRDVSASSLPDGLAPLSPSSPIDVVETCETVSYTREFAEVLAERRAPRRVAPVGPSTDDARHAPTLVAGALACMLTAGTCGALWYAIAGGTVAPSGHRADGLAVERSLVLAPFAFALVPIHVLMDSLQPAIAPQAAEQADLGIGAAAAATAMPPQHMSSESVRGPAISVASGQSSVPTEAATKAPAATIEIDQVATTPGPTTTVTPIDDIPPPFRSERMESAPAPLLSTPEPELGAIRTASRTASSDDVPSSPDEDSAEVGTGTQPSADPAADDAAKSKGNVVKDEKVGKSKGSAKSQAESGKSAKSGDQNAGKGQSGKSDADKGDGAKDKADKGDKGGKGGGGKGGGR